MTTGSRNSTNWRTYAKTTLWESYLASVWVALAVRGFRGTHTDRAKVYKRIFAGFGFTWHQKLDVQYVRQF